MSAESYQSEKELENRTIKQLIADGYEYVEIPDTDALLSNFRDQIEKHNEIELNGRKLTDREFDKLMNQIEGKNVFVSAKNLRQKQVIKSDDGKDLYIELFNAKEWCKNKFQVTHQITNKLGKYENRYDITLLINGLPLVNIELKRTGIDFKEAFNQVVRYSKHSFNKGLFRYLQFFVISNGMDTKYFANSDKELLFSKTFYWTNEDNERMDNLWDFTTYFLPPCHVAKMIARYMVLEETNKTLMIMRPYQVYAVEKLSNRATETNNNAYVWHTTGSGKTLTSFKLSQLLSAEPMVNKVFFLVDRKDLDTQTLNKFNSYQADSVDSTDSTDELVGFMKDSSVKLVLTTIQKMANACRNEKYKNVIDKFASEKVVFIIDECHRSQFGDMHKIINSKFPKAQYFGFTGTPRFKDNPSQDGRTTTDMFTKCLHTYLIKDAIKDNNVLGWSVDYVKTINAHYNENDDTKVEAIDTDEVIMDPKRLRLVAENILKIHNNKTRNGKYNAIFTVKSIDMLIKYYDIFKEINKDLKIGAIFTYGQNEESEGKDEHSRDALERIIKDYNQMFGTDYSTGTFSKYFTNVSSRVEKTQLDILIVVDMFLTGFDAPMLNTLYIDKRMKDHNLIQSFSRTNRVETMTKPFGNIVCYQTTKNAVDSAVKLFSRTDNTEIVLMKSMEEYIEDFKFCVNELKETVSSPYDIELGNDTDELKKFVLIFRNMIKILSKLQTFSDFVFSKNTLNISKQEYEEYLSKYLGLAREMSHKTDKVSVLSDVDFCLELLHNDKITVRYILNLLQYIIENEKEQEKKQKNIEELIKMVSSSTDSQLRLKAELIENFLRSIVPALKDGDSVDSAYNDYMDEEREKEIINEANKYGVSADKIKEYIAEYEFGGMLSTDKIKNDIPENVIKKIKEQENIYSIMKTKTTIVKRIINFVKNTISKFM